MGNIKELAVNRGKEEKSKEEALRIFNEQHKRDMEIINAREYQRMAQIEKDFKAYQKTVKKIISKNNITHLEQSIIVIEQDGKTHVYSRFDWFAPKAIRDNCKKVIIDFMKSIGNELVLDQDGNPTNDIEWHFENIKTDYHFILNALNKHGYT